MASLKDVAEQAGVPLLVAFRALKHGEADSAELQRVLSSAAKLNYQLRITQIDIADLAGVAKGTVSYALNHSPLISEATRQRVWDAADTLEYRPNTLARSLRKNQAGVIGYSWHIADDPSLMNNLLDRFIYRVTIEAEQHEFHLLTFVQPQEDADRRYDELFSTSRVDGFIISDVRYADSRIARLTEIGAPFVAFGGMYLDDADFAFVDVDGKMGIRLLVEHLVGQGHQRIGLMNWEPGWPVADARQAGYLETMQSFGLKVADEWIVYTPNTLQSAAVAAHQLLQATNPPTAIICTNDVMAFGAKSYFDEVGIRPGVDVALAGYDDDQTSNFLSITSIRQPVDEVAAAVVDILMGEINGQPADQRQVVFDPMLVVRGSTQPAENS